MNGMALKTFHSGVDIAIATTISGSMPYFGPSSRSMSSCWFAFSASSTEYAQSSMWFISRSFERFTTRRIVRTPNAAWRASSCSTRRITSSSRAFFELARSWSMMPTAMPSKSVCMPRHFIV